MKIQPITLEDVAFAVGGVLDKKFASLVVDDVSSIERSTPSSLIFYNGAFAYSDIIKTTPARACFVMEKHLSKLGKKIIPIVVQDPYLAIANIITKCIGSGEEYSHSFLSEEQKGGGISKFAVVASSAKIGKGVVIMPYAYVGCNVEVEDGAVIHSHVSLEHCKIGKNSVIRSGARIGSAGFGFVPNFVTGQHISVPQISRVILGENVDIGANSSIDRGFLEDTKIGDNTKIDNLVHIGHGVEIGKSCFLAGCAVIGGSTKIGNFVMIGGNSAISGHISIADYTQITGMSGVVQSVKKSGEIISGTPASANILWKKMHIHLMRLVKKEG